MWQFTLSISRRAVVGALLVGVAVAISSFGIVRADFSPDKSVNKVFKCMSGKACVEGDASGKNSFGLWGNSAAGTGVQGNSSATNSNSGVAGVNSATSGKGYGVYGRSSNGPGMYGTSDKTNGIEGHTSASGAYGPVYAAGIAGFSSGSYNGVGVAGYGTSYAGVYAYGGTPHTDSRCLRGVVVRGRVENATSPSAAKRLPAKPKKEKGSLTVRPRAIHSDFSDRGTILADGFEVGRAY